MSTARKSTLAHMNQMIAAATIVGTLACNKCNSLTGNGYMVVDPMPPPARCPGIAGSMTATVRLVPSDAGPPLVEITLTEPTLPPPVPGDGGGGFTWTLVDGTTNIDVNVSMGKLVSQRRSAGTIVLLVEPTDARAASGNVYVELPATCSAGPATVSASVYWGPGDGGPAFSVSLSER